MMVRYGLTINSNRFIFILSSLITAWSLSPCRAQNNPSGFSDSPEFIDPVKPEALDFLSADLSIPREKAMQAYEKKDYTIAARYFLFLLHHKYDDPISLYSLASCYAQLGKPEPAAKTLLQLLNCGFSDVQLLLNDPNFNRVRNSPPFDGLMRNVKAWGENLGELLWVESRSLTRCRLKLPDSYDPSKSYPLVIGLHGWCNKCEDFMSVAGAMRKPHFLFAAPETPYLLPSDIVRRKPCYSWDFYVEDKALWQRADPLVADNIINVVKEIKQRYRINRVYLLGHSQGVSYAYLTAMTHPDLINGVVCFAGYLPTEILSEDLLRNAAPRVRVYIAHGKQDRSVDPEESRKARKILEKLDFSVVYQEFEGGHELPAPAVEDAQKWIERIEETEAKAPLQNDPQIQ